MNRKRRTNSSRHVALTLAAVALIATPSFARTAASFQGLGDLPGGIFSSVALGVSTDGSVVVGRSSSSSGTEAFRWMSEGGMVGMGDLAGGLFESKAWDVSADGSVVVGFGSIASVPDTIASIPDFEAFRWTSGSGMVRLGDLPGGFFLSRAFGVSADGLVVVGDSWSDLGNEAFRWTSAGGMVGLGSLTAGIFFRSNAWGVSADGSVVVGSSNEKAFRWTNGGGMVSLGDLAGGNFSSLPLGVSSNGSVVVGRAESASGTEAFRWTSEGGMVGLGDLVGGIFESFGRGVSGDGSVVVGDSFTASGQRAFIWNVVNGMQNLKQVLETQYGLNLTGWTLNQAWAISDDGLAIVGWGINPDGNAEAWIATLASPPECRADINGDGSVNVTELLVLLASWGTCPAPECPADFNADGFVNVTDLLELLASWGACP